MRIYNNYDGYINTIKALKMGIIEYEGTEYNLDDEEEIYNLLIKKV